MKRILKMLTDLHYQEKDCGQSSGQTRSERVFRIGGSDSFSLPAISNTLCLVLKLDNESHLRMLKLLYNHNACLQVRFS